MKILCLNAGSSSLKAALFEDEKRTGELDVNDMTDAGDALDQVLAKFPKPDVVGHRVVHGGPKHTAPAFLDDALIASLKDVVKLAPLHMPAALKGIEAVKARNLPQVACFDTAFHADMPSVAKRLPIPKRFSDVHRYGFHGLSYEYIVSQLKPLPDRVVVAHLGNGASLCAISRGKSVDTTMGLTPTGGIPMSTRAGDLDPGVVLYLLDQGADAKTFDKECGLEAIAGEHDVKKLLERDDADAKLALAIFARAIAKTIGAYAAVLGGLDALVFTGGIGEHAAPVRAAVCATLGFLGVAIDPAKNARHERDLGEKVHVIPTDEDLMVARHTARVMLQRTA